MSDTIDRDATMKAMYHRAFETDGDTMWQSGCWVRYRAVEQVIKSMPSAQRWIPVTERLPEDSQFVLMTIRRMGENYNHEQFISVGYISWNQSVWWCAHDGDCKSKDVKVDAWMPLPEPYKEDNNDTTGSN